MLASIGLFFLCALAFMAVFLLSMMAMNKMHWWPEAGLAALIPMGIISTGLGLLAGGLALWALG